MSRLPRPGQDEGLWGDILNDFLAVSHMDDGTIRVDALPQLTVSDGSITPAKLSMSYVPLSYIAAINGIASLDNGGKVPLAQMPSGFIGADATTTSKGVVQLTGDLSGTAAAPTVPALSSKYEKPGTGIPEADLSSDVITKLNTGGAIGDSSTTTKGLIKLAGDLAGTADLPTVPGLSSKIDLTQKGAVDGVATLDGTGRVPTGQLPAGYEADATTTTKGIIMLAGDLAGTAAAPTVPGKANDSEVVHKIGNETITGLKVFTSSPEVPDPQTDLQTANKRYVDNALSGTRLPTFSSTGSLMVEAGSHRLYNDSGAPWQILSVRASVGLAPTGASLIIDINIDGTTIFTTQANRPTIAASGNTSGKVINMDVSTVPVNSYLTVDIDQIGSTIAGSDLTVQIEVF